MAINIFPRLDVSGAQRWSPLRKGHWSTQGLVVCCTFGQGSKNSQIPGACISSYVGNEAIPQGVRGSTTAGSITLVPAVSAQILPLNRVTVLALRQCRDTTARSTALFGWTGGGSTSRLGAHVPYNDNTVYWDFGGFGAPNRISVVQTKTTQLEAWAFIAGANGSAVYRNGLRLVSQSTAITRAVAGSDTWVLNGGNSGGADDIDIHFFAVLDAEWTPSQISEWTANPWIMFATQAVYVEASAAPVSTETTQFFIIS